MLLADEDSGQDLMQTSEMLNPNYQHLFHVLRHRALHPGQALPRPPPHVTQQLATPARINQASVQGVAETLRQLFRLEEVEESGVGKRKAGEKEDGASKRSRQEELPAAVVEVGHIPVTVLFTVILRWVGKLPPQTSNTWCPTP